LIYLRHIMKLSQSIIEHNKDEYILRGFIVHYSSQSIFVSFSHIIAYFYSINESTWKKYDDSKITNMTSFGNVYKSMVNGNQLPLLLVYEKTIYTPKKLLEDTITSVGNLFNMETKSNCVII
jgi:hypothetical protein